MRYHMPRAILATMLLFLAHAGAVQGQQAPGIDDVPELAGLSARWTAALQTLDVPGFAVAVVKDGKVLALDAFGVRNVAGDPATIDTAYYIASATKPFTAMGLCLLAGEGKISLDDPVRKHLPQLQLPDAALTQSITIRDLLCHRHGINCDPIVHRDAYTGQIDDEIYFRLLREAEIARQVRYTNVHFTLAGRVIEAVSGQKWQDFLNARIFDRAGMTRTTAYASEMYGEAAHAEPMLLIGGSWERSPLVKTDRTMHAAGGMGTTARDAARWLILNTSGGQIDSKLDGARILPKEMEREYFLKQSDLPEVQGRIRIEEGFALGWGVGKYREQTRPYYFHGGGYVGAASYFCFVPNERIGVAVLANSEGGNGMGTIVSIDILDRLLGVKDQPDLLPVYEEQARERRAAPGATRPSGVNPASARDGLSRPAENYVGTYSNPQVGEIEVFLTDMAELAARSGDLNLKLLSRGPDRFEACAAPGMTFQGEFAVNEQGEVTALEAQFGGETRRYERVVAAVR